MGAIELGASEHLVQPADESLLNVSAGHAVHALLPEAANVPARHLPLHAPLLQAGYSASLNRPLAHCEQV